jgi:hypothetical protein
MNVGKMCRIRVLSAALVFVFGVGVTGSTTVYVNDRTRGPSDTFQIDGVGLSAMNGGGWLPCQVLDQALMAASGRPMWRGNIGQLSRP